VLIDASILARALLASENPARAVDVMLTAGAVGAFELLLPPELLIELADLVATRPYFVARVTPERRAAFLTLLQEVGTPSSPYQDPFPALTRDPGDDYLLAYAQRDSADYLVTGDRDLLDLAADYSQPRIVDGGTFVRELRKLGLI
jgi:putative PIN family toxin of toxin-antitoxin system